MVLVPSYSTIEEQLPDKKYIIKKVDIVKIEDTYHEKFVLKDMGTLSDNDSFLYIDPDHILNNIFEIPNLRGDSVLVSSEVRRLSEFINKDELDMIKTIYNTISNDDLCFNTSLIYCSISYFNIFFPYWESVYNSLYSIVGHRHLEEIALSIAAKHYKFNVKGIDNNIQGNFNNENFNSKIFHYGGEYPKANYIKSVIINSNLTTEQKYQEIIKLLWSC